MNGKTVIVVQNNCIGLNANVFDPLLSSWEGSMKQVHDADELSEACSEAREVEKQYPGQEQPVRDIRLENESQVVENVLPPLTAIPPAMLGKAIRRSDRST